MTFIAPAPPARECLSVSPVPSPFSSLCPLFPLALSSIYICLFVFSSVRPSGSPPVSLSISSPNHLFVYRQSFVGCSAVLRSMCSLIRTHGCPFLCPLVGPFSNSPPSVCRSIGPYIFSSLCASIRTFVLAFVHLPVQPGAET